MDRIKEEWDEAERVSKNHEAASRIFAYGKTAMHALLGFAVISGVLMVGAVAPNVFVAFHRVHRRKKLFLRDSEFKRQLQYAKARGYFSFERMPDGTERISITKKGLEIVHEATLNRMRIKKTGQWDGIWRIVIFDIPRRHNAVRNVLRARLKLLGMHKLQESVFVSPYPCEEEIGLWASLYNAQSFIRIIHANAISNLSFSKDDF